MRCLSAWSCVLGVLCMPATLLLSVRVLLFRSGLVCFGGLGPHARLSAVLLVQLGLFALTRTILVTSM